MKGSVFLCFLFIFLNIELPFVGEFHLEGPRKGYDFQVSEDDPNLRWTYEIKGLIDPGTGRIPSGIQKKEREFIRKQFTSSKALRRNALNFTFAGPGNVGGRTRAAGIDVTDDNTLLAGGVSGGMWKSVNGGINWRRVTNPLARNSITTLAQDEREGKTNTWYYGSGELRGNSASITGIVPFRGDGIFKSVDNGETWESLPFTTSDPTLFNSGFQYVHAIETSPKEEIDEVFAAVYGGIVRSQDGGASWETVLGTELFGLPDTFDVNDTLVSRYTDIEIEREKGFYYATLSGETPNLQAPSSSRGYFFSIDGETWTRITPSIILGASYGRTVIEARDSVAYFLTAIQGVTKLLRLQITGITADNEPEGFYEDLSANLPNFGGNLGDYNTQTNYNMLVRIDPDDPDIVYLGGRNLWRSTDGFRTRKQISWIGGYDPLDDFSLYPNHHPDQHELLFFNERDEVLSFNDGGIWKSSNFDSADSVEWQDLNAGYITSQFYAVAIQKDVSSDLIAGGLQDNGTHVTTSASAEDGWFEALGGDGGFSAFANGDIYRYHSLQRGQIFRMNFSADGQLTNFARVDPQTGTDGGPNLFITPFVLDPVNSNVMYFAGGTRLWRNSNLAQVPSGFNDPTTVNWEVMDMPLAEASITALEVSGGGERLFVGTGIGELFRFDQPSAFSPAPGFQLGQEVFPDGGYISCIASNPDDPDELLVVFSNYGVVSVYWSTDGGISFVPVAGSLEENEDGSGDGPSVRWAEIVPLTNGGTSYFLGTSVGLFSSDTLRETTTEWVQEGSEILGSSVVRMMDYRPLDGRLVVSTHGNGIYRTTVQGFKSIRTPSTPEERLTVANVYPNPLTVSTRIDYTIPEDRFVRVDVFDTEGNTVKNLFLGPQFAGENSISWDGTNTAGYPVKNGLYVYRIRFDQRSLTGKIAVSR